MNDRAVTLDVVSWVSGGPRKVEPAEARNARASVACQRTAIFGLRVEPVSPP